MKRLLLTQPPNHRLCSTAAARRRGHPARMRDAMKKLTQRIVDAESQMAAAQAA